MARAPIGGLMDTNVPSQLDEADLSAELELEIPDSQETPLMLDSGEEIEIVEEDDGGVLVDFDPSEDMADVGFDENLAELAREQTAAERLGVELDRDIIEQPMFPADQPLPQEEG